MRVVKILLQIVIAAAVIMLLGIGAAWLLGPRTAVDTTITFDPKTIGADLDTYLAETEADIPGIQPQQHKQIVWADPEAKTKTPIAIIYIHGFSASPGEVRPMPDIIAKNLHANLFYARLTGHGTTTDPMANVSVNAWVNDIAEAVAIGERLGERVVVIASSTGASLATWAMAQPEFKDRIHAAVFLSPNYGLQASGAFLLTQPFARQLAHLLIGKTRAFEPHTYLHRQYWTTEYPVEALMPMGEIVKLAINAPVEKIKAPVYMLISPEDTVVVPDATRAMEKRWGGPHTLMEIVNTGDPSRHVLAGDALSPATTEMTAMAITEWLQATLSVK